MPQRDLDELDRYVIYRLQENAWETSAAEIAADYGVSPSTVRNRIIRLRDDDVIQGSHIDVDYERVGYQLFTIIFCTAPIPKREQLARDTLEIPGVVSARELMTGEENIHVVAVGRDGDDLSRIGRDLASLGLEIVEEELVHNEYFCPFHWFGLDEEAADDASSQPEPNGE